MDKETLDYEILQCVDRGLGNCGQSLRHSAYWQLLVVFNLKASAIPSSPEVFSTALEKIFGSGEAVLIEREIVKEFMSRFQIKYLDSKRFLPALEHVKRKELAAALEIPDIQSESSRILLKRLS